MRTLKLLTVTALVAAALALAPAAYAQTTPTVTVLTGRPTPEGDVAIFVLVLSEPATPGDIEVAYELEETERVGEHVNSNFVPDGSEGVRSTTIPWTGSSSSVAVYTRADGVHEDSSARNGRTNPLTLTILPGPGYEVGTPASGTVRVGDDEPDWGTVAWESTDVTVSEGAGHVDLALTLSKPYSYPLRLPSFAIVDSADAGDDFDIADITGDVLIPPLSRRITVRVGIVDDDQPEYAESFRVQFVPDGLPVNAGDVVATVRIADDDEENLGDTDEPTVTAGPAITDGDGSSEDGPSDQQGPSGEDGQDEEGVAAVESCVNWCVRWSGTTLAEGESVTMSIRDPGGTVADSDEVAVTLHVGRTESTADVDDIAVEEYAASGQAMRVHPYETANMHHQGGWIYTSRFFPYGQAKVRTMTVEALDNLDGADSETLATWVYVNGDLAGSQVLTITNGPQTRQ